MPDRPLIIFPIAERVSKRSRRGRPINGPLPPTDRIGQAIRLERQFGQVCAIFVSEEAGDIDRALVMETTCKIEGLQRAVERIDGLEWLVEIDVDEIELHDLYDEKTREKVKGGRFYVLSTNKKAIDELFRLWKQYKSGKKPDYGYGKFKVLFDFLITLRYWNAGDRLRETGILEFWRGEYKTKEGTSSYMDFEIELHYRKDEKARNKSLHSVKRCVENEGGSVGQSVHMEYIAFHAIKARLPVGSVGKVLSAWSSDFNDISGEYPSVFKDEGIRYIRPIGQHINIDGETTSANPIKRIPEPIDKNKPPVLALLDGVPLLKHAALDDRIVFSDPNEYKEAYEPLQQKHGTAMASLMCHGDLNLSHTTSPSLTRRIYVRPVMKPNQRGDEIIPFEFFQEDIIERAVIDIFEGDDPAAPSIRVINLSLANIDQLYFNEMSPWARLLDWLSFKYKTLFIVSAGNYPGSIQLGEHERDTSSSDGDSRGRRHWFIKSIDQNQRNHRLFSPAESINALTVGALQGDASDDSQSYTGGFDPIRDKTLPAPYSRIGPGYRGSIKPDIFTWGGKLLYDQDPINKNNFDPVPNSNLPGVQTAYPGAMPELLDNTSYGAGTSHAAAIVSHSAGHIFETLEDLRKEHYETLSPDLDAVLIKTLLVHSASQGKSSDAYRHLKNTMNRGKLKRYCARYLGYGAINIERALECTRTRATAIGCGHIDKEHSHRFVFPLPITASIQSYLQLTVTLSWFSPINPRHIGFRRAKMFFESDELKRQGKGCKRQEADGHQVRKGTVQHEIFRLDKNNLSKNDLDLIIRCDADAGILDEKIPYGLAVTLEVAEKENIDLYQEVKERIRQPIKTRGA